MTRVAIFFTLCIAFAKCDGTVGDGACANDVDTKIWNSTGKTNFDSDMDACGKKCWGAGACVKDCMKEKEHYSDGCAKCFGDTAQCTKDHCMLKCMHGKNAKCEACVNQFCTPTLETCSGITPPATLSMEIAAVGSGACINDADSQIWDSTGKSNFDSDMDACGRKCWGADSCVKDCMKDKEKYSDGCAQCFGDIAQCTKDHCMFKCMSGKSASCNTCVDKFCTPALKTCSGLTPPAAFSKETLVLV